MGVKFANALGAHVVITTSPEKEKMLNEVLMKF
jgi:D-arabinose 1-dehydrogenase-like Zn-dependent alcohol dehydrogenase